METLKVKNIGVDDWGRKTFINVENHSRIYKDVDGVMHTTSKDGEPDSPILNKIKEVI